MSNAWRSVFSFNKYSEIAARAVRASLKEDQRVLAEKRGLTALRYQKWENSQGGQQVLLKPEAETKATRTSLATDFPLRNPRNRPGKTVLLHICGFAITVDDLLHWADTHNIEPNAPFFKRLDVTRREILDRLPWKIEGPHACLFVDHETEKLSDGLPRPATCFFVGTNGSQKALDQAKNEDLIRGFQEVLDTQEKPR
ncbi:hypothetical protein ARMGADRAFT_1165489 [Armillaria gallica]|uniref:Uncharacterized protein n=1 Tax=Armillaria gallica TaxID=47427 RepID=A0A2H3DQX5_ARMGA|nr:hypothetical protein ARMGADRAFT_1165489 [Armillaria gallica]